MRKVVTRETEDGLIVTEEVSYPLSEPVARYLGFVIGLLLFGLVGLLAVLIITAVGG